MNARQRGTRKKSDGQKASPKKPSSQREATKKVARRDQELGGEIRKLRDSRKETQLVFAKNLKVSLQRLSAWENGEKPPVEKLLQIAILALESKALPETKKLWFWQKAGVEPTHIFGPLWAADHAERERVANEGAILVPLKGEAAEPLLALPSTRILHPKETICLLVPDGVRGVLCESGDLVVVDASETEPRLLLGCSVAASFSTQSLNLRQIVPGSVQRGRLVSETELDTVETLNPRIGDILAQDELMRKHGPKPGVRVGWLGIQYRSYPEFAIFEDRGNGFISDDLWRLILQPAVVAGLGVTWEGREPIHLSKWQTEPFPLSGPLVSYIREGVQIAGRVIGWFSSQQGRSLNK